MKEAGFEITMKVSLASSYGWTCSSFSSSLSPFTPLSFLSHPIRKVGTQKKMMWVTGYRADMRE